MQTKIEATEFVEDKKIAKKVLRDANTSLSYHILQENLKRKKQVLKIGEMLNSAKTANLK